MHADLLKDKPGKSGESTELFPRPCPWVRTAESAGAAAPSMGLPRTSVWEFIDDVSRLGYGWCIHVGGLVGKIKRKVYSVISFHCRSVSYTHLTLPTN